MSESDHHHPHPFPAAGAPVLAATAPASLDFLHSQKLEAMGHLASSVAHDFNNILTAIIGFSDLLLKTMDTRDPRRRYVEQVIRAGDRGSALTRQLLAFSRRDALRPRLVNVNQLLQELAPLLQRLLGEAISLTVVPGERLWPVKVDPSQLEQVLVNLVLNARDAMADGGELRVACRNLAAAAAGDAAAADALGGPRILVTVTDTGAGMSEAVKAHLFEPFFTTKPPGKGTGLGLATCSTIVRQLGGHIAVDSQVGRGTTVSVELPRAEIACALESGGTATVALAGGEETVLLVEDEPAVRDTIAHLLRVLGYEVLEAGDGAAALEVLAARGDRPVHLVVADVVMPRLGGAELAATLRLRSPDIKVLFTSGYPVDAVAEHGIAPSETDFLEKPYSSTALALKVRELLDRPHGWLATAADEALGAMAHCVA